jgi:hypothetical protein
MVPAMILRNGYKTLQFRLLVVAGVVALGIIAGAKSSGASSAAASSPCWGPTCSTYEGVHSIGTTPARMVKHSEDVIREVFGPELAPEAIEVAICESDLNPKAVSPTDDHGLFQISIINKEQFTKVTGQPWSAVYNTYWNTRYTKTMWNRQGWQPWVCKFVLGL